MMINGNIVQVTVQKLSLNSGHRHLVKTSENTNRSKRSRKEEGAGCREWVSDEPVQIRGVKWLL